MVVDGTGVAFDGGGVMVDGVGVMVDAVGVMADAVGVMADAVGVMVEGVGVMVEGVGVMVEGIRVIGGGVGVMVSGMACWGSIVRPEDQNGIQATLAGKDVAWPLLAVCARSSRRRRQLSTASSRIRFIGIVPLMKDMPVSIV